MYICSNASVIGRNLLKTSDVELLSDGSDHLNLNVINGLRRICLPGLSHERLDILSIRLKSLLSNILNEVLELLVLRNKVGLRVNLYNCSLVVSLGSDAADSLCSNAAGLLNSLSLSVLSEEFHSGIHIAVCLVKSLLTIHHSGAALLTQLLYHGSTDLCHNIISYKKSG